jgi:hypothetical protein
MLVDASLPISSNNVLTHTTSAEQFSTQITDIGSHVVSQQPGDEKNPSGPSASPTPGRQPSKKRNIFQWIADIFKKLFGWGSSRPTFLNQPPTVSLTASSSTVTLAGACPEGQKLSESCTPTSPVVQLSAQAKSPTGDTPLYTYSTDGGRVTGDGPHATLDLTGAAPGRYKVTVENDYGHGLVASSSTTVAVSSCDCLVAPTPTPAPTPPPCPTVTVSCPDTGTPGTLVTFTANVSGGNLAVTASYDWTVSAGRITSGQGTSSITVDTTGLPGNSTVAATVTVGGYAANCNVSSSCTTSFPSRPVARKVDEFGNITFDDEKARLENFAIELRNDPTSQGYLICYGGRYGKAGDADKRCARAKGYLAAQGIDSSRLVMFDGGYRDNETVELWKVPQGAPPPPASPTIDHPETRPTPATSPTPGESPSQTPLTPTTPTPAPTPKNKVLEDYVSAVLPSWLSVDRPSGTARFRYELLEANTLTINANINGNQEYRGPLNANVNSLSPPPPLSKRYGRSVPYATVRMISDSDSLVITPRDDATKPVALHNEGEYKQWQWELALKGFSLQTVDCTITMHVEWRDPDTGEIRHEEQEPDLHFTVWILPLKVRLLGYGSTTGIFLGFGFVGLGRMRRLAPLAVPPSQENTGEVEYKHINAWVEEREEDPGLPLVVGESYTLSFQVGREISGNVLAGGDTRVAKTDIPEEGLDTQWVVISKTVRIETAPDRPSVVAAQPPGSDAWEARFSLHIPREGESERRSLHITPLIADSPEVEVYVYVAGSLYRQFSAVLNARLNEPGPPKTVAVQVEGDVIHARAEEMLNPLAGGTWQEPPGKIEITVAASGMVIVSGTVGGDVIDMSSTWGGEPTSLAGLMKDLKEALEKFREVWEGYLNNIDASELEETLRQMSSGTGDLISTRAADGSYEDAWSEVAASDELSQLAYYGRRLYDRLFPRDSDLRNYLDALEPGSVFKVTWIKAANVGWLPHVPWGLLYHAEPPAPGQPVEATEFFGLRYRIQYIKYGSRPKARELGELDEAYRGCLLYWGTGDAVGEEAEWQRARWPSPPTQLVLVPGDAADQKTALLGYLTNPHPSPMRFLYIYCHCDPGDGEKPVLRFGGTRAKSDVVELTDIYPRRSPDQPLVFVNACSSGTAGAYIANELESYFFESDYRAYIGTEGKVPARMASRFAYVFGQFFFGKVSESPMAAGEAFYQARQFLWNRYRNIGGLFYSYVNRSEYVWTRRRT